MHIRTANVTVAGISVSNEYYTGAPDNRELVEKIVAEAYPSFKTMVELTDSIPEGATSKPFRDLTSQLEPDFLKKESERLGKLHERYLSFLLSQTIEEEK